MAKRVCTFFDLCNVFELESASSAGSSRDLFVSLCLFNKFLCFLIGML